MSDQPPVMGRPCPVCSAFVTVLGRAGVLCDRAGSKSAAPCPYPRVGVLRAVVRVEVVKLVNEEGEQNG